MIIRRWTIHPILVIESSDTRRTSSSLLDAWYGWFMCAAAFCRSCSCLQLGRRRRRKPYPPCMVWVARLYIYARKTLVWRNLFWMSTQAACFCCFCCSASGCWEDEHCPMALSLSLSPPSRCALICFAFFLGWRALGVWFYICCIGYGWARWWHSHHVILFLFYIISFKLVLITNMKKVPQSAITF